MSIEMKIPKTKWESFKDTVMNKWFVSDEPILTRHKNLQTQDYEFASFESEYQCDIDYVISIIPLGGDII